jgi:hypothetical protein
LEANNLEIESEAVLEATGPEDSQPDTGKQTSQWFTVSINMSLPPVVKFGLMDKLGSNG